MCYLEKWNNVRRSKNFKYGLPFLCLMIIGSFGLQEFTDIRYRYSKKQTLTPDEASKYGIEMKKREDVTLEKEYEKISKLDIDNWENIRGPRPWEENFNQQE